MALVDSGKESDVAGALRSDVVRRFVGALFYDMKTADAMANYFVRKHLDLRCKGSETMDDLVRAVLMAPFDMTLVTFYALATPTASNLSHVAVLSLFAGHTLAVPIEFLIDAGLCDLVEALKWMMDPRGGYYSQMRHAYTRAEISLEAFTAKRDMAQLAWPPLLATLCYRHFVSLLELCVKNGQMDAPYAHTLIRNSTKTLRSLVEHTDEGPADTTHLGRLELLTCIPRELLLQQLTRLHVTLGNTIDLGMLTRQLEKLAIHFAGYCTRAVATDKKA
jgi:hypothetical protein